MLAENFKVSVKSVGSTETFAIRAVTRIKDVQTSLS